MQLLLLWFIKLRNDWKMSAPESEVQLWTPTVSPQPTRGLDGRMGEEERESAAEARVDEEREKL